MSDEKTTSNPVSPALPCVVCPGLWVLRPCRHVLEPGWLLSWVLLIGSTVPTAAATAGDTAPLRLRSSRREPFHSSSCAEGKTRSYRGKVRPAAEFQVRKQEQEPPPKCKYFW